MNPDLYACLPSDKKEEYRKLFPKPVYIERSIRDSQGYSWVFMEPLVIPEEWLYVTKKMEELNDLEYMKTAFEKLKSMESELRDGSSIIKLADEIHKTFRRKRVDENLRTWLTDSGEWKHEFKIWFCL